MYFPSICGFKKVSFRGAAMVMDELRKIRDTKNVEAAKTFEDILIAMTHNHIGGLTVKLCGGR